MLHLQVDDGEDKQECGYSKGAQPPEFGLHCIINIVDYNSLDKLLGVTAYALRFIYKCTIILICFKEVRSNYTTRIW